MKRINFQSDIESRQRIAEVSYAASIEVAEKKVINEIQDVDAKSKEGKQLPDNKVILQEKETKERRKAKGDI